MIVYSFELVTDGEKVDALRDALASLKEQLAPAPGFLGCLLMKYVKRPFTFRFDERWESAEAHDSATEMLPKEVFQRILAGVTEPAAPVRLEVL